MTVTREGRAITEAFEGCLKAVPGQPGMFTTYYCPAHVLTIGVGHTNAEEPHFAEGVVWPHEKCMEVLGSDLRLHEAHVAKLKGAIALTPAQNDCLTDWSFNTGGPASSSVWTYVRAGDIEGTCERLSRWTKGGGRELPGLVRRRKANCLQYRGDVAGAIKVAGAKLEATTGRADRERPQPSGGELATRTKTQSGTIATGAGGGGATSTVDKKGFVEYGVMAVFAVVALVGLILLVKKITFLKEDWA